MYPTFKSIEVAAKAEPPTISLWDEIFAWDALLEKFARDSAVIASADNLSARPFRLLLSHPLLNLRAVNPFGSAAAQLGTSPEDFSVLSAQFSVLLSCTVVAY